MPKVVAVSLLFFAQVLWAQAPSLSSSPIATDTEWERRAQQASFQSWATDTSAPKRAASAKQAAEIEEFYSKARHFVELWRALAVELNDKKTFNAKLAKQVSKAFHDLEKSNGWPVGRSKLPDKAP
jgi:hypothetical protein